MKITIFKKSKKWQILDSSSFQVNEKENIVEVIWLNEKNQYQLEIFKDEEVDFIIV